MAIDATTTSLLPQVATGTLDLAVVNLPVDEAELAVEPLFDEDRILIAPADHPLATNERVGIAELSEHPLLLEPVGTGFRDLLDQEAARAGVALQTKAEVDGMRLLASLAVTGFGAAVVPATALPFTTSDEWTQVPLDGIPHRSVGLVHRRRGLPSAPARALRAALVDVVAAHADAQGGIRPTAAAN